MRLLYSCLCDICVSSVTSILSYFLLKILEANLKILDLQESYKQLASEKDHLANQHNKQLLTLKKELETVKGGGVGGRGDGDKMDPNEQVRDSNKIIN